METPATRAARVPGSDRFQAILNPLKPGFAALERFLAAEVESFEPEVRPLVRYCFGHSGKKLRPVLVFSMAMDEETDFARDETVKAAAIVELVHLATLVHDDILDGADLRHRTETVVSRHGSHVAVLLGDALFAHSLHLASQFTDVTVCREVSKATRQVCSGEIAQTFSRGSALPTRGQYFRMIELKTAELFTVSAFLGGYLSGLPATALEAARRFARHLGVAYQIYDDAADIFAEEAVAGKTLGTDLGTGKFTLPVLLWLEGIEPGLRDKAVGKVGQPDNGGLDVRRLLLDRGILGQVEEAFSRQLDQAVGAIRDIPGAARQEQLQRLAAFLQQSWNKFSIR
ncbi:MAG: polyprenyl synthetase family protein [Oceanipulchritudo sp.]